MSFPPRADASGSPALVAQARKTFMYLLASHCGRHMGGGVSAFNCNCLADRCCFNILYRFLCNTVTCRQPEARINSVKGSSFVKSQSCFNDA